jgi:hypothetical protein
MATFSIPVVFVNATTIQAVDHNDNWLAIKSFVDGLAAGGNFNAGAINTEDIADDAITSGKIEALAVTTAALNDGSVTAAKLAADSVTTGKIAASITLTTPNIGAATGTSLTTTGNVISHIATNAQTGTTYTLVAADDGRVIELSNASPITMTVPLDSSVNFTVGTQIILLQTGAGQVTVAGAGGVTVNATPGLKLRTQWSSATLIKRAADTWVLIGDLSA